MGQQQITLTGDELQAILRQQQDNLIAAIRELKEPDPVTKRRMDREIEAANRSFNERMKVLIAEQKAKEDRQAKCIHGKNNGAKGPGTAIHRGQIHSDGKWHPLCTVCGKEFEPIAPSPEEMAGAVA